eukprot:8335170-Karenia_brevis.AAC.1
MDASTNNTKHEIIEYLESIIKTVNEHDDKLDNMRSTALESMQRNLSIFRGEGERIVDNMMDVMQEMRDRQPDRPEPASSQR